MRTVAWLREELAKFPDDALCFAYKGEVIGVVVQAAPLDVSARQGVIYCSESDDYDLRHETEFLPTAIDHQTP